MMKNTFVFLWEVTKIVIIALLIVIPIRSFVFQPFFVKGQSMEPTFENGDYLIIDEFSYHFGGPQRGEVVVFNTPIILLNAILKGLSDCPAKQLKFKMAR